MKKLALLLALLLTLTACGNTKIAATDLMAGIPKKDAAAIGIPQQSDADKTTQIADFSLALLKSIHEGKNTLISPLSIVCALVMTANGAKSETLSQMEAVFHADINSLNRYLQAYSAYLPTADKYKVSLANSIWFKDAEGLAVEKAFLQTNRDYYDAQVYKAPFDERTKNDINAWVNQKTDGQIKKLLEEKPPADAVMYLINALSFDAEWQTIYKDTAVRKGEFTAQGGAKRPVDFMHSTEYAYIRLANAAGFSKPYADAAYSFVAILPDEGLTISDFIASMDGKTLIDALYHQSVEEVYASMPKFAFEYDKGLAKILQELGMKDAFDINAADFGGLGQSDQGNIFISQVLHKTKIEVDEKGTKAGAVTAVMMAAGSAAPAEPKIINLDRPFFFMIVDNAFRLPIFMGVLNDVAA